MGRSRKATAFVVAAVGLSAVCILAGLFALYGWHLPTGRVAVGSLAVFFVLYTIGEAKPIRMLNRADAGEFAASATFAYALLLSASFPVALTAIGLGTLLAERRPGADKSWLRSVFNVSQVVVAFAAGGSLIQLVGAGALMQGSLSNLVLLVLIPSGLVTFTVNMLLISLVIAVDQGVPIWQVVRAGLGVQEMTSHLLLLGLSPVFVLVWTHNWLLTPMLLIAIYATWRSTQTAVAGAHDSRHDALTGLPNRRMIDERLAELTAVREQRPFAAMLMDLDRFKTINDVMGHHVGDQLLIQAADRLRGIEGVDVVARVGGDEFAFVVRDQLDDASLLRLAEHVVATITAPYEIQDVPLQVGASLGIARYPQHGHDAPSLMRRADSAMYLAKRAGNSVRFASANSGGLDDREGDDPGRNALLADVEIGLDHGQFRLDHQPQVDMATGRVIGVEALLRWDHPEHGPVSPSRFVPAIEHTELYATLTRHVLRLAMADQRMFAAAGFDVPVAVNISARDLLDTRLPRDLAQLLAAAQMAPDRLTLEITENALVIDLERAQQVVAELTELGVGMALDDFGTGYASLGTLRDLPVAELKIDRSFVADIGVHPSGASIVKAIVHLAHDLGLHVVAEGIETDQQFDDLRSFGCDIAQGYLISRPIHRNALVAWLRERNVGGVIGGGPFVTDFLVKEATG